MEKIKYAYLLNYLTCNYHCPYCNWYNLNDDMGKIIVKENIIKLKNFFDTRGKWHIEMSGGEVMINPNFIMLCKSLTENHYISMYTNLSKDIDEFIKEIDYKRVKTISCSLQQQAEENFKSFYDKIRKLKNNGFTVQVTYVVSPDRINKVEEYFQIFKDINVPFIVQPFIVYNEGRKECYPYSKNEYEILDKHTVSYVTINNLIYAQNRKSTGKICSAGYSKIYIDGRSGNIYPCQHLTRINIGNAYKDELKLFNNKIKCPTRHCSCQMDDKLEEYIEKFENKNNIKPLSLQYKENIKKYLEPISNYDVYWENKTREFLKSLFAQNDNCRILIYGGGTHTLSLLKLINDYKINCNNIIGIIDSDYKKVGQFVLDKKIFSIDDILGLKPNKIVISSKSFEEEIYKQIKYLEEYNIEVIRMYNNYKYIDEFLPI